MGTELVFLVVTQRLTPCLQETHERRKKEFLIALKHLPFSLKFSNATIKTMTIHTDCMLKACKVGHLSATDLADFLVKNCGIPLEKRIIYWKSRCKRRIVTKRFK